ncbi:hypothetical protein RYX36_004881 [Vicia faba]
MGLDCNHKDDGRLDCNHEEDEGLDCGSEYNVLNVSFEYSEDDIGINEERTIAEEDVAEEEVDEEKRKGKGKGKWKGKGKDKGKRKRKRKRKWERKRKFKVERPTKQRRMVNVVVKGVFCMMELMKMINHA